MINYLHRLRNKCGKSNIQFEISNFRFAIFNRNPVVSLSNPLAIENRKFSLALYIFLFLAVFGLSGCSKKTPKADEQIPSDVVVIVNGLNITDSDLEALVKPELERMKAKAAKLPAEFIEQYEKQVRQLVLDKLISGYLLDEKVKEAKIVVTEDELMRRITEIAAEQQPPLSLEEYQKKLEEHGQSFEAYKNDFRKNMLYQKLLEPQLAGKLETSEDEIKQYYSDYKREFETPEQVRASHILIKPDTSQPGTDPNEAKAIARAKTESLLKQIREGADFAELAKANSADRLSAEKGGDLDFFPRGKMVAPFEKAAFNLQTGQISDVVETKFGYHIIKVTDRKEASAVPFEQAKDYIIAKITQKRRSEIITEYIESLKDKAQIVYPIRPEQNQ
jgi:peptidyl-prolyl cis-trans isomerase C